MGTILEASGGSFSRPFALEIDDNGDLLVADADAFGGPGGVVRVDPDKIVGVVETSEADEQAGMTPADELSRTIAGHVVDGDAVLAHRLQQCRLRTGRGTIDFVRQDQIVKNRSVLKLELTTLGSIHLGSREITWQ